MGLCVQSRIGFSRVASVVHETFSALQTVNHREEKSKVYIRFQWTGGDMDVTLICFSSHIVNRATYIDVSAAGDYVPVINKL